MKRRAVLLFLFLAFAIPLLVDSATLQPTDGFSPRTDVDIWLDAYGRHIYWWTGLDTSDTIYVEVEVTSGPGIDFFICDEANWDIWEGGGTASVYRSSENVGSVSTSFNIPSPGTWYVVFDSDSLSSIHIEGYVGLSPLYLPDNTAAAVLGIFGFLVVIAVLTVVCTKASESKHKLGVAAGQQTYPQYVPVSPPSQPPVSGNAKFCPYCGSPRQLFDAKFCQNCGRSFSSPDSGF